MSENDTVVWFRSLFLSWSDFKAEYNPSAYEDSHSTIFYRPTWVVDSEQSGDDIMFVVRAVEISVEFHRQLSWVRASQSSDLLLRHEQGHFDLAELVAREHVESVRSRFDGKEFPTRGKNEEQRKQFARTDSGRIISSAMEGVGEILAQRRKKYDHDTDFGQDAKRQSGYDAAFAVLRS